MCGVAGVFGDVRRRTPDAMLAAEAHRGPDDRGTWCDLERGVWLGHARLAVIDVSPAGHQPMEYLDGRLRIVFNGEIYNFLELRAELEAAGYRFRSRSDTEVVLAAYAQWGARAVERFRGMFAFALFDRDPPPGGPELVLARDRFGIKPLLVHDDGTTICFASELRAVLAAGGIERVVDREALLDYLAFGAVLQPRTIARGVFALPPGHWLEVRGRGRRLVRYWDLHESTAGIRSELRDVSEAEAIERLRAALLEATRAHMIADVPVGAFLSGGIDSTAIVGFMARTLGRPIRTFSVGYEARYGALDETAYASAAARHLRAEHEEVRITAADAAESFPKVVAALDQPSIDGTNTWMVSRAARRSVTVALSGLGGDELFAGYPHFSWLAAAPSHARPFARSVWAGLRRLRIPSARVHDLLFRKELAASDPAGRFSLLRRLLTDPVLADAVMPAWRAGFRERLGGRHAASLRPDADAVQQTSYAEVRSYLTSTLLRDGDVMSMAHGLEVRPVLLDHVLAELAYALPARLKCNAGPSKALFIAASAEFLPEALRARPKMGFALPFVGWMGRDLRPLFRELVATRAARELFAARYLRALDRSLVDGRPPFALWAWGVLLAWLQQSGFALDGAEAMEAGGGWSEAVNLSGMGT